MQNFKMEDEGERRESTPLLQGNGRRSRPNALVLMTAVFVVAAVAIISIALFTTMSSSPAAGGPNQLQATSANSTDDNGNSIDTETETIEIDTSIQVEVEEGLLQGQRMTSRGGREYFEFRGIPYAKPPLGELRFQPPQPPDSWEGVRDATRSPPVCIQKRSRSPEPHGSEDCLYLNVFTPKPLVELTSSSRRRRTDLLPVIFYIHGGGGGAEGDGARYSGEYFMDEDVIFVTIDYRLGVLGALNLNITAASGNQGLKDQVQGLRWVKSNIQTFGGDKNRVTLVGNSAGAHQVSTHMLSPMSAGAGLIHGGIAQSGASIAPGYLSGNPVQDGIDLGLKMNCTSTKDMNQLLDCFRNKTASEMVVNSIHLRHWFTFTYSVDSASEPGDVFLPQPPLQRLFNGTGAMTRLPLMIGVTSAEGLPQASEVLLEPRRTEAYNQVPWTDNAAVLQDLQLQLSTTPEVGGLIAEEARQFYFANEDNGSGGGMRNVSKENIQTLSNMFSDRLLHHSMYINAQYQFQVNNGTTSGGGNQRRSGSGGGARGRNTNNSPPGVFMYIFSHKINVSRCQDPRFQVDTLWGIDDFGVCHADELQFFFPNGGAGGIYPAIDSGSEYEEFSRMVVKLWASFAADGAPSGTTNNVSWIPVNGTKPFQAMELNENPQMVDFFPERMAFWDQFNLTDLYR